MGHNNFTTSSVDDDDDQSTPSNGTSTSIIGGALPSSLFPTPSNSTHDDDIMSKLIDYNEKFKNAPESLFRDDLIDRMTATLISKGKPNALLVGPAGVGKTNIVEELARRIAQNDPRIPDQLQNKTIYEMPISAFVSGNSFVGMTEKLVESAVEFFANEKNNAIMFLDEIHLLTSSTTSYETVAQILKPALGRGRIKVIGATTTNEARLLEDDPAFNRRFNRINVPELSFEQTVTVIEKLYPHFEDHYQKQITIAPDLLPAVARIADQFARVDQHRPDVAITLLDRCMAEMSISFQRVKANNPGLGQSMPSLALTELRIKHVAQSLMTTHFNKHTASFDELRNQFGQLKGQDQPLSVMIDQLRRDALGLYPRTKPLSFLLAGQSGCGKTRSAHILAEVMTNEKPIFLNMGEFAQEHHLSKLIGSPRGYVGSTSKAELPFDALSLNPYRVIVLDEIEKAHETVRQFFLSALDQGYATNAQNNIIDFSKCIVIATTNAGREGLYKGSVGFGTNKSTTLDANNLKKHLSQWFALEFLGRFSSIIAFNEITRETYSAILASIYLQQIALVKETNKALSSLPDALDDDEIETLTKNTFVAEYGARPAYETIKRVIEDAALALLP